MGKTGGNFTGGNPCPQQGRTRDEALEAAGPVSERDRSPQHPRICLQTGFRKERRVPPPQGWRAAVPGGDPALPWATVSPSVRPPPSAPRREGESAAAADLCGSAGFSPRAGTHRLCLRALSPRPRGASETIKKEREESANTPAHTHRHGRTQTLQRSSGDQFPQLFRTAAGLRGALKTGSQWCNFEGNSQSQAIKG